ncbi:MAG: protein kinase [Candidatus Eremiobacterota bacterium]
MSNNTTTRVLAGRYQLETKLGEGGMGSVYRALDLTSRRTVAVKILRRDLCESKHARRRFAREARASGMLNHPGVVRVFDYVDDVRPFIVMELLDGVSLRRHLRREKPPVERVLELMESVCDALDHAHGRGVVHRDMKPDNVVVTREGRIKVLDFGLARVMTPELSQLTRSGSALGTCSYMSPEQAAGKEADERSDLYALGVMLYEFLCGATPFSADDPASILYMHVHEEPEAPRILNPDLHPELEGLILRLMAKDPSNRPPTALQLKADFQRVRKILRGELPSSESPAVVDAPLLDLPTLPEPVPGDRVSLLAADVPNFSRLTRDRNPLETTELESVLVEELENSVRSNSGRLLERYGTRVLAAFCGDDHGERAVRSARVMRTRVQAVLQRYSLEVKPPSLSAGIFGGKLPERGPNDSWEDVARQELMHGASRLEKLSRDLQDDILISADSLMGDVQAEPLRSLFVRGRQEPVQVYRILVSA